MNKSLFPLILGYVVSSLVLILLYTSSRSLFIILHNFYLGIICLALAAYLIFYSKKYSEIGYVLFGFVLANQSFCFKGIICTLN